MTAAPEPPHAPLDCITAAAQFLAGEPAAVERALRAHRQRPDGRCTGCGPTHEHWPCATASSALRARELLIARGV